MKKRNHIALLATTLFCFSCSDVLETIPSNKLSSEIYWKTVKDAEYAANAIYDKIENFVQILEADNWTDITHHNFYGAIMYILKKELPVLKTERCSDTGHTIGKESGYVTILWPM